jgi:hypothetical protein
MAIWHREPRVENVRITPQPQGGFALLRGISDESAITDEFPTLGSEC